MRTLAEYLPPGKVDLFLKARDKASAVEAVLQGLAGDPEVRDFAALKKAVELRDAPVVCENGSGLLIAHGRTESVSRLVLAAGRCESPFLVSGSEGAVRLVFVAGIPTAFSSEYLRVVGAIVRVCRNPDDLAALLSAATTAEFVERLTQAELKL